jgi:MYND finger
MQSVDGCFHCGALAKGMSACQRCYQARYCSRACQKAAWRTHQANCNRMRFAQSRPMERAEDRPYTAGTLTNIAFLEEALHVRTPNFVLAKSQQNTCIATSWIAAAASASRVSE